MRARALLAVEVLGTCLMWAPIPIAWMWVGSRVYNATGSIALDGAVAFLGFVASIVIVIRVLIRLDRVWIGLRQQAGHDQDEGALTEVVAISATLGLVLFVFWYYASGAFVLPFMPAQ